GIPGSDIAPAHPRGNHDDVGGFFHDSNIDRGWTDAAVRGCHLAVAFRSINRRPFLGHVPLKSVADGSQRPKKNPTVPKETFSLQKLLRFFARRLFDETLYRVGAFKARLPIPRFNIPVTGVRAGWNNPQGDEKTRARGADASLDGGLKGRHITDEMVRRQHN